VQSYVTFLD